MNRKIGFTLIELLVVIAVVGLLVALLLPAVQATRASARNLYCKSNMRQIGLGIHSYAESYRGKFPWTEHRDGNESWIVSLSPFLEQVDMIRICPEDPRGGEWLTSEHQSASYAINNFVADDTVEGYKGNMHRFKDASRLIVLFEADPERSESHGTDHIHCSMFYSPVYVALGKVFEMGFREVDTDRHAAKSANYLFADGHVENIFEASIKTLIEIDLAEQTNFARPNQAHRLLSE